MGIPCHESPATARREHAAWRTSFSSTHVFSPSYWGMNYALPFLGAKSVLPVINLPLLAAITPPGHTVTIFDENVEDIDYERCARADIVGHDGHERAARADAGDRGRPQGARHLHRRGRPLGDRLPAATSKDIVDAIFIGEAEETWPRFLDRMGGGAPRRTRYEQDGKDGHGHRAAARGSTCMPMKQVHLRQRPALARLPVHLRVLRHHRGLRPQATGQDLGAGHRRAGGLPGRRQGQPVHRRRQPDRQQEGHQGHPARHHRLAGKARLPPQVRHRSLHRPRRGRRAAAAHGGRQHRRGVRRHRVPQRGRAARDQEDPEPHRQARQPAGQGPPHPGAPASRSGAA